MQATKDCVHPKFLSSARSSVALLLPLAMLKSIWLTFDAQIVCQISKWTCIFCRNTLNSSSRNKRLLLLVSVLYSKQFLFKCLDEHRASVTQIRWNRAPTFKHVADRLTLASADTTGTILIWNVKTVTKMNESTQQRSFSPFRMATRKLKEDLEAQSIWRRLGLTKIEIQFFVIKFNRHKEWVLSHQNVPSWKHQFPFEHFKLKQHRARIVLECVAIWELLVLLTKNQTKKMLETLI